MIAPVNLCMFACCFAAPAGSDPARDAASWCASTCQIWKSGGIRSGKGRRLVVRIHLPDMGRGPPHPPAKLGGPCQIRWALPN